MQKTLAEVVDEFEALRLRLAAERFEVASEGGLIRVSEADHLKAELLGYTVDLETGEIERLPDEQPVTLAVPVVGEIRDGGKVVFYGEKQNTPG